MKINNWSSIAYNLHKACLNGGSVVFPHKNNRLAIAGADDVNKPNGFRLNLKEQNDIGVLISGGLDSIACYLGLNDNRRYGFNKVKCYYYDIGQPYKNKELKAIKKIINKGDELIIIKDYKLNTKGEKYNWGDYVLPFRNMIFLMDIAERMQGGTIVFGVVEGELKQHGIGDKGIPFIQEIEKILVNMPFPIRLEMPLKDMTKGEIVKWYLDNGYKKELKQTMSCLTEEKGHCGKCKSCFKKGLAFLYNGLELKTNTNIRENKDLIKLYGERTEDVSEKYINEMRKGIELLK